MQDYKLISKSAYKPQKATSGSHPTLGEMMAGGLIMAVMVIGLMWFALIQATGGF